MSTKEDYRFTKPNSIDPSLTSKKMNSLLCRCAVYSNRRNGLSVINSLIREPYTFNFQKWERILELIGESPALEFNIGTASLIRPTWKEYDYKVNFRDCLSFSENP